MKIHQIFAFTVLASAQFITAPFAQSDTAAFAAIDWCPQLCPEGDKSGYILDIVKEVYKDSEFEPDVSFYPWTRANGLVDSGRAVALLSPTKAEAPQLRFPEQEVGVQRVCFFTKTDSPWQYTGIDSLKGKTIGLFKDGYFGEINDYIAQNDKQFQALQGDGSYVDKSFKKLDAGRIDAFLYTHNAIVHEMQIRGIADDYRAAGCVLTDKLYVGFTNSSRADEKKVQAMIDHWDKTMTELKKTDKIAKIMEKYGLDDWTETSR